MDRDDYWSSSHYVCIPITRKEKETKNKLGSGYVLATCWGRFPEAFTGGFHLHLIQET